nr:hypothetical protein [Sphingobium sp. OAS761]
MEDVVNTLPVDAALVVTRKFRLILEIALHFGLRLETACSKALQRFAHDGGQRLLGHQYLVLAPAIDDLGELIADRRLEYPIAIEASRAHPVERLLGILLALVLIGTGEHILDEAPVAVFTELVRG